MMGKLCGCKQCKKSHGKGLFNNLCKQFFIGLTLSSGIVGTVLGAYDLIAPNLLMPVVILVMMCYLYGMYRAIHEEWFQ